MPHAFAAALSDYRHASQARAHAPTEEAEAHVDDLFWRMANTPARTSPNLALKGWTMLAEYGETGELRTDLIELLLEDISTLN